MILHRQEVAELLIGKGADVCVRKLCQVQSKDWHRLTQLMKPANLKPPTSSANTAARRVKNWRLNGSSQLTFAATVKTGWKLRSSGWQSAHHEITTDRNRHSRAGGGVWAVVSRFLNSRGFSLVGKEINFLRETQIRDKLIVCIAFCFL